MGGVPERLVVEEATFPRDGDTVRGLFREYAAEIAIDLCFQGFERELATLPGRYAAPVGCVLLAHAGASPVGVGAIRRFRGKTCEMKRLYVRPQFRGLGVARELVEALLARARDAGYRRMVLDTLGSMVAARTLYGEMGFAPISAYYANPLPDAIYLEARL